MKKLFRVVAWISFFICCLIVRQMYRNDFQNQSELFLPFIAASAVLFVCVLVLKSKEKFKAVPGREYEILKWTKVGDKHLVDIRYLNENSEYDDGTLQWEGGIEFLGSSYRQGNKYFIEVNMVGVVFSSVDYKTVNECQ